MKLFEKLKRDHPKIAKVLRHTQVDEDENDEQYLAEATRYIEKFLQNLITSSKSISMPILNKWINALKGEKFTQGRDYLLHKNKFCCLGVLCAINDVDIASIRDVAGFATFDQKLPFKIKGSEVDFEQPFVIMNDEFGFTFHQIATITLWAKQRRLRK